MGGASSGNIDFIFFIFCQWFLIVFLYFSLFFQWFFKSFRKHKDFICFLMQMCDSTMDLGGRP